MCKEIVASTFSRNKQHGANRSADDALNTGLHFPSNIWTLQKIVWELLGTLVLLFIKSSQLPPAAGSLPVGQTGQACLTLSASTPVPPGLFTLSPPCSPTAAPLVTSPSNSSSFQMTPHSSGSSQVQTSPSVGGRLTAWWPGRISQQPVCRYGRLDMQTHCLQL